MSKVTKEILIVESEAVVYAQYKHREKELMIMFNRGVDYTYFEVPVHVWRGLQTTDSIGGFVSNHIRSAYDFFRRTPVPGSQTKHEPNMIIQLNNN